MGTHLAERRLDDRLLLTTPHPLRGTLFRHGEGPGIRAAGDAMRRRAAGPEGIAGHTS